MGGAPLHPRSHISAFIQSTSYTEYWLFPFNKNKYYFLTLTVILRCVPVESRAPVTELKKSLFLFVHSYAHAIVINNPPPFIHHDRM